MNFRTIISTILFSSLAATAPAAAANPAQDDFDRFRQEILSDFQNFRRDIMSDYARFLESNWAEFERFKGESRSATPKPPTPPVSTATLPDHNISLPEPTVDTSAPAPDPQPIKVPVQPALKTPAARPQAFSFYGLPLEIERCNVMLDSRLSDSKQFASQWRKMLADPVAANLANRLGSLSSRLGLNDYLTFDLIRKYVQQVYPNVHSTARAALTHFLMTSLGFDARIATSGGEGVLLIPTVQTVYGRPYMKIGNKKFYVFSETDNVDASSPISTCMLPDDAQTGREIDMRFNQALNLPEKPKQFTLKFGDIALSGELNENIYPIIYRYPQTDMAVYASSVLDPDLRAKLVDQLKRQLSGKSRLDAVNALLSFTQNAIDYATDDANHGFEKPYFLEEWLYYPRNDCEDRATFYTYMLWNVLGVECQMITYPGHESASVCLDEPVNGDCYEFRGKKFFISDPTYIGAKTGMCMPDFVSTAPEIEYHYKK